MSDIQINQVLQQMRAMAAVLPGEQAIYDVVAFIRSLEP